MDNSNDNRPGFEEKGFVLNRRDILTSAAKIAMLAAIPSAGLAACSTEDQIKQPGNYYDMLSALRDGLRGSPDHPKYRAKALVAQKDITALHAFVRDEIRLVSSEPSRFALGNTHRFGPRAALRAGTGTAHEKASILADLLQQAGYKAEVVMAPRMARDEITSAFFRTFEADFEPTLDLETLQSWSARFPDKRPVFVGRGVEADTVEATRLKIEGALTEADRERILRQRFDTRQVGATPIVEISMPDGTKSYADPITANGAVKPATGGERYSPTDMPDGTFPVEISIGITRANDPATPIEILNKQWTSDQLAGRKVSLAFAPKQSVNEIFLSRVGDLRAFTPVMGLIDNEPIEDVELEDQIALGKGFTIEGDIIERSDTPGETLVNGIPVSTPEPSGKDQKVASIDVDVSNAFFPDMELEITPRDADGDSVRGLSVADFKIEDQGSPSTALLEATDPAPTILFLADASASMPDDFKGARSPSMQALSEQVLAFAKAQNPTAKLIQQDTNSKLWEQLAKYGEQYSATLIVYATDGAVGGKTPETDKKLAAQISALPPIIALSCATPIETLRGSDGLAKNVFDDMAQATQGTVFDALTPDVEPLKTSIQSFLETLKPPPAYKIKYRALVPGTGERTVKVMIGSGEASALYTIDPAKIAIGQKLASIKITVKMNGRSVTRTLAGHNGLGDPSETDFDAAHGAMFGHHMIAFEGAAPSVSVILDEMISARLSRQPIEEAVARDANAKELIETFEEGFIRLNSKLASLMSRQIPMSGDDYSFSEQGLRTVLFSHYPIMNSEEIVERMDILPLSKPGVLAENQDRRRALAFERSITMAHTEANLFGTSTVSLLSDQALIKIGKNSHRNFDLPNNEKAEWAHLVNEEVYPAYKHPGVRLLTAPNGQKRGLWAVDVSSGEIIGVLGDGSGGGSGPNDDEASAAAQRIKQQLIGLDKVIASLNLLAGQLSFANPVGGFSLGVVAIYGQHLARLYAAVSMTLILTTSEEIEKAIKLMISGIACDIAKSAALEVFGGVGKVGARAVKIFNYGEAAGTFMEVENSPFSCPSYDPTK